MKIKLAHILTDLSAEREIASVESLSVLSNFGIQYIQQINIPYKGEDWKSIKNWANDIYPHHGPGHYGAFQSFKKAILENFTSDIDGLILCECDCVLSVDPLVFSEQVKKAEMFCKDKELSLYSFGSSSINDVVHSPAHEFDPKYSHSYVTDKIVCAHCIFLPASEREFLREEISYRPWETPDVWFNMVFHTRGVSRFGISSETMSKQHPGISLIDGVWKDEKIYKGIY